MQGRIMTGAIPRVGRTFRRRRKNMRPTNLTLMTDLYELTMMQGYF